MAKTMRAAVVREFGAPLRIEDVPVPDPGDDAILVKVEACGVCHTDLHAASGDWPVKPAPPFIPGHEGIGRVVGVGRNVRGVKEGDRVGVPWLHAACGHCHHCVGGWETLCAEQTNTGYSVNGAFADYVLAANGFAAPIPDGLDPVKAAPLLCAGVTVYKGIKETEARPGQTIVVSGIGGLGHMAVQYAKAMGLYVIAVDVADDKLDLARRLGADETVNAITTDPIEAVQAGGGAEGVLVTAVSREAFRQGVGMLARHGTMSLVGLPPGTFDLDIFDIVLGRKTIRGSIVGTRLDLDEALDFAARGIVSANVAPVPLEAVNDVFDKMRAGTIEGRLALTL
ncbi:zinc-dependent alcohol dehydrogenase [Acuticoccus sp. M5D2P5]|uniref:zinc-dependent alcohol dehydrogenase n=1 Tax=Acuticoccus kalidii TaxID=2910977 RepID=UPI001F1EC3DF|nr:zinc-dependent alcohol dehydrogenase [Acuticoccus kalidii]MCF3934884.1 zinc-dependent alcohol dehydrogenase [Acuticoccus kalidii]